MQRTAQLCELLGTRYPLMQGGMAHISDARLAAAVSNAGGLGILSAASGDPEKVAAMIDETRALTDKPVLTNGTAPTAPAPNSMTADSDTAHSFLNNLPFISKSSS